MDRLQDLENSSIYIIREAFFKFKNTALLWSVGKDSTALLWLIRKAFLGEVPVPVIHLDTGHKFAEIYKFRDRYAKAWDLKLIVEKNESAPKKDIDPSRDKFSCCTALKTDALKQAIKKHGFDALYLAIRRDEHGIRAKERFFSLRDAYFSWDYRHQPLELWGHYQTGIKEDQHVRIHPLLGWREIDVWQYIKREGIPVVDLYFSRNNLRFRSIGCECCCNPVDSGADSVDKIISELGTTRISERSGRAQDKESDYIMQKLRSLGYM